MKQKDSELFEGLTEKLQIIPTKIKEVQIHHEGNTGQIKKVGFKQKKRNKISFYGPLTDVDVSYIIK